MNRQKTLYGSERPEVGLGRAAKKCGVCGRWFTLPNCHAAQHSSCSKECSDHKRAQVRQQRSRVCVVCAKTFFPRVGQLRGGGGKFCSVSCMGKRATEWIHAPAARAKAVESRKNAVASGRVKILSGSEHPQWTGGQMEARKRRIVSGKAANQNRKYRARNPDRVREWAHRRKDGKTRDVPRLEYGTISKLLKAQRSRCAYCSKKLPPYHVDHIEPINLGGRHEPRNLQLLCPTCNVKKWATAPEKYAQKIGLLL